MRSSVSPALSIAVISALAGLAAGGVMLYRFDPAAVHFFPPCLFHSLTGLQCPGCGTTRALHHLLHGDVAGAFHLNPMLFAVVPFGVLASTSRRFATHRFTGWGAAVVTVAWWIGRNLV